MGASPSICRGYPLINDDDEKDGETNEGEIETGPLEDVSVVFILSFPLILLNGDVTSKSV